MLCVLSRGKYTYVHDAVEELIDMLDVHHVFVRGGSRKLFYYVLLLMIASICYLVTVGPSIASASWLIPCNGILTSLSLILQRNAIQKESVVIMPKFGVQFEIHYKSGRVMHRFIPTDMILKPVLNECVTPFTCFWSLGLLVRGEADLVLVFQKTKPPLKILLPIWSALCRAIEINVDSER